MWIAMGIIAYILFFLVCVAAYAVYYVTHVIQVDSFSQVIYTLNAGTSGAENTVMDAVSGFFAMWWPWLLLGLVVLGLYCWLIFYLRKARKEGKTYIELPRTGFEMRLRPFQTGLRCSSLVASIVCMAILGVQITSGLDSLGVQEYMENKDKVSQLYEEYFVEPSEAKITYPEKKKNLIHIVVESMENTYASPEQGGAYEPGAIDNLYRLAKEEGTDFSAPGTVELNGAEVAANTGWTVAGLVAQSSGVTLNIGNPDFNRSFDEDSSFLPHVTTLGQLLESRNYSNYFMCGSPGAYAGRQNYYQQHGDYEIYDFHYARGHGWVPPTYNVWWGYEDEKLFQFAKEQITEIAKSDEPFNFTMLTADTHFANGYLCDLCPDTYEEQYPNVVSCSDQQLGEFVGWLKEQDFWDDTVVVISGDHLSMDGSVGVTAGSDYNRKAYFAVLNGPEYTGKTREFTTLDIFPTIMEALGCKIEGGRLGLGTSLYSGVPTLAEELGIDELNAQISQNSDYYTNVILSGDESKIIETDEEPTVETDETGKADPAQTAPSAQAYMDNADNFANTDYIYVAPTPTDPSYETYYPSYSDWTTQPDYGYTGDTQTPSVETPDTGAETPGTGTETPGTGTETPGTGTETPGTGTETPGTGTETPGTGTETPGTGTETPGTGTETPGTGTETPGTGTETPGAGAETPSDPGTESALVPELVNP